MSAPWKAPHCGLCSQRMKRGFCTLSCSAYRDHRHWSCELDRVESVTYVRDSE